MAQTLGLIDLTWRGKKVDIEKGGKVKIGGLAQKAVVFGKQVDYAQEMMPSEITCTAKLARGDSLLDLYAEGAGELQVLCDTGQTYVWSDAFLTERPEFTAGEGGKIPLKYQGGIPSELVN